VIENKKHVQPDATIEAFLNGERALVVGSSWSEEEEIVADSIAWLSGRLKVIVAPHDIGENHLLQIEKRFGSAIMRYSKFDPSFSGNVLLIDSIGRLANAYRFGNIAFVGGGFSGSLHNILEPAVFGLPVLFGPKHKRFPEAQTFMEAGVGFEITDALTFQKAIQFIFENESVLQSNTANLVLESTGATQRIMDFIQQKRLAESNQPT
jgi:3-deoxy-D-manno-octulosonic-acid transferase